MSNEVKLIGFKASIDLQEDLRKHAESLDLSVSAYLRRVVEKSLTGVKPTETEEFILIKEQIKIKDEQLDEKGKQIDHLHQIVAMQQKTIESVTEKNNLLLESKTRSLWGRLIGSFGN
tara:strand:+ start:141 stop:494 length:354 start_codon:yes stop_codon:yes gene_type:complete